MSKEPSEVNIYTVFRDSVKEIKDQINNVETKLLQKIERITDGFVSKEVFNLTVKDLDERLDSLESDRRWLVRLIIGQFVLSLMGTVGFAAGVVYIIASK